jgi:murein L,D-transpeptidase YafK
MADRSRQDHAAIMQFRLPRAAVSRNVAQPLLAAGVAVCLSLVLSACSTVELAPHLLPLSKETMMLLGKKGMDVPSPMFIRIFKEESEFEVWKQRADGRFYHFKTYPICNWSGGLGPKIKQGDKQAPEGFYKIARSQMNPNSQFYLAFNMGFPNAYDKANKRTGDSLMVHGKCKSAGCYAMTDALIEEIYALARESYIGGQETIQVHAMPFRMTEANMSRHKTNQWYPFWQTLKQGYDHFELTRTPPDIAVCQRQYMVNVKLPGGQPLNKLDSDGACPAFERPAAQPFAPLPGEQLASAKLPAAPANQSAIPATQRP